MYRSYLAVSALLALLTAAFSGSEIPKATEPHKSADANNQQANQPIDVAPLPGGNELVLGWITGTVNVNGQPVQVKGSVNVRGGPRGPNSAVGIALSQSESARPDWSSWPMGALVFVIPDSSMDEMVVLHAPGDWAQFKLNFGGGGYLWYDISVTSVDPPAYRIALSGDLKGETVMPELPWHRTLNLRWYEDGTICGDATASGRISTSETYCVPAIVSGRYFSADPGVRLPAEVSGKLAITAFDPKSGHWAGRGSRAIATPADLNDEVTRGVTVLRGVGPE